MEDEKCNKKEQTEFEMLVDRFERELERMASYSNRTRDKVACLFDNREPQKTNGEGEDKIAESGVVNSFRLLLANMSDVNDQNEATLHSLEKIV